MSYLFPLCLRAFEQTFDLGALLLIDYDIERFAVTPCNDYL